MMMMLALGKETDFGSQIQGAGKRQPSLDVHFCFLLPRPLDFCQERKRQSPHMQLRALVSLLVVVPAASFAPLAGSSTIKLRRSTLCSAPHPARGPTAGFRMLSMQSKPEATEQLAVPLTLLRVVAGVLMIHHG